MSLTERLTRRVQATRPSLLRVASLAVVATVLVAIAAAAVMRAVDRDAFPTIGAALWWSAQTVTTVGYGDVFPESAAGRGVAVVLMITGIGFLTVFTATIASIFVTRLSHEIRRSEQAELERRWGELEAQLDRIEQALRGERDERGR
jgi:voltage-gated potassium channel